MASDFQLSTGGVAHGGWDALVKIAILVFLGFCVYRFTRD